MGQESRRVGVAGPERPADPLRRAAAITVPGRCRRSRVLLLARRTDGAGRVCAALVGPPSAGAGFASIPREPLTCAAGCSPAGAWSGVGNMGLDVGSGFELLLDLGEQEERLLHGVGDQEDIDQVGFLQRRILLQVPCPEPAHHLAAIAG